MTSTYGESVKFYDRMSILHGQLKSCEEEQHILQEEFGKLWNQSSPRLSEFQVDKQVTFSQNELQQNGNNLHEDERRRQRNKMLLDKIKELEANASVFAARSEKLKVLRSEYDAIAKRFLANRGRYKSPSTQLYSSPVMNGSIKSTENLALKSKLTDAGVNTEITGEIIPADSNQSVNSATASLHYRACGVTERIQQHGQETSPVYKTGFQVDMEVEKLISAASQRVGQQNNIHPVYPVPFQSVRSERHLQTLHETQRVDRLGNTMSMEKEETINNIDMDEKIKHNSFFDLSTTSESELTSSRNPPRRNVVPVNIIMDDTTQSDTFSMPLQIPLGNREVPDQLLKMNLTSESESLVDRHRENGQQEEHKHLKRKNHTKFTMNEGQDAIPEYGSKPTDKNDGQEDEASEASVSFTTTMGDSVMDSIQNKTLDESFRLDTKPESRRGSVEDVLEVNSSPPRMAKTLEEPEIPTKDKDSKDFDVFKVQNESIVTSEPSIVVPPTPTPAKASYLKMNQMELMQSSPAANITSENNANLTGSSIPMSVKDDEEDRNNQTFDLETQWNVETDEKPESQTEKGTVDKPEARKEVSDTVIPAQNTAAASARPTTAAAAKANSAASRRMRIKLDYDSDSEPSEPVQPAKPTIMSTTNSAANQQPTNAVEDDDFDDFFDI